LTLPLLIGTQNPGKLREYQQIFAGLPLTLLTLADVGLPKLDVAETGTTFAENAELKATAYAQASGKFALADDSGLCVNGLDGRPGVYSARYAGAGASDADRRTKLLDELASVSTEDRSAYFECVIVVFNPTRQTPYTANGRCTGRIATAASDGEYGFGYDAIFIPDGYNRTLADLPPDEKHAISHRGQAARAMRPVLERIAQGLN
jgi:XTP/dITP diphosphohydrolase